MYYFVYIYIDSDSGSLCLEKVKSRMWQKQDMTCRGVALPNVTTACRLCLQIDPKKRASFDEISDQLGEMRSRFRMAIVLADISNPHLNSLRTKTVLHRMLGNLTINVSYYYNIIIIILISD